MHSHIPMVLSVLLFIDSNGDMMMKDVNELVHENDSIQPSGVSVDGLTASWSMDPEKPVLSDVSFTINKVGFNRYKICGLHYFLLQENPLLAVVGPVGAGKVTNYQYTEPQIVF